MNVHKVTKGIDDAGKNYCIFHIKSENGIKQITVPAHELIGKDWISKLNDVGANIITSKAINQLRNIIESTLAGSEAIKVINKIGWYKGNNGTYHYVLPDGIYPPMLSSTTHLIYTQIPPHQQESFTTAGIEEKWEAIYKLLPGNPRLIFSIAYALTPTLNGILDPATFSVLLTGEGGKGKTAVAKVAGAVWGGSPDARQLSAPPFGVTFNSTVHQLEQLAAAYCGTLMVIDETSVAEVANSRKDPVLNFCFRFSTGESKGRMHSAPPLRWAGNALITSNLGIAELGARTGEEITTARLDRMIDIPLPTPDGIIFEDLHGHLGIRHLVDELLDVAYDNYGHLARNFVVKLADWRTRDEAGLRAWLANREAAFYTAAGKLETGSRDANRLHRHLARVYMAGALMTKFGMWPLSKKMARDAVLACEDAHLKANEHLFPGKARPVAKSPREVLRAHVLANRMRMPVLKKGQLKGDPSLAMTLGAIEEKAGFTWLLLPYEAMQSICGGPKSTRALLKELQRDSLIELTGKDKSDARYVTKRAVGLDGAREWVVAINVAGL